MCTVLVASRMRPDLPLIVAANRDEFLGRPAQPPREVRPGVFAGLDLEKGGTWLGATRAGLFVGLTNQHTERLMPPAARSRGEVVLGALEAGTVEGALAFLQRLDPADYNPFNLLVGDAQQLVFLASWQGPRLTPQPLGPGLHVLANDRLRSPLYPKTARAESLLAPLLALPWGELQPQLSRLLADHVLPPVSSEPPVCDEALRPVASALQALCVHTEHGYGTRSASILAFGPSGLASYLFADGAPCVTAFVDVLAQPPTPSGPTSSAPSITLPSTVT